MKSLFWNGFVLFQCLIGVNLALSIPKSDGSSKITGGVRAECQEFPWMAFVQPYGTGVFPVPCGGSVINSRCILTLDVCLWEENTFSIFGVNNITDIDSPGYEIMTSAEYYSYPNKGELSFAPGLLVLPKPIAFSEYVQPIHLYDTRKDKLSDFVSDPVVLAGWGHMTDYGNRPIPQTNTCQNLIIAELLKPSALTDVSIKYSEVLRKVNTTVITNEECEQLFSSSNLSINQDVICTSGGQGVGACPGDSGVPINYYDAASNRWMQIGIVAFGSPEGCKAGLPDGAYRLGSPDVIDWIESVCGPLPV